MRFPRLLQLIVLSVLVTACSSQGRKGESPVYKLEDQRAGTTWLTVSADSRRLASGGWSGHVAIRNLEDSSILGGFRAHRGEIMGLAFSSEGALVSAGREGSVKKWSDGGRLLWEYSMDGLLAAMTMNASSNRIAVARENGDIEILDAANGQLLHRWSAHDNWIGALAFTPDARLLASSDTDRSVKLWDAASGELLWQSSVPTDSRDLVFSDDGKWLYGGGWFDIFRWDVASGESRIIDTEHHGIINGLAFIPGSGMLASVSRETDSSILIIDPVSGETRKRLGTHDLCGGRVAVSPDEKYLISNSADYSISVWEIGAVQ